MKTFKEYLYEEEQLAATPAADIDPGERILDVQTTPEIDAYIEANTVRDADGDVDFAGSLGKMMSGASEKMDIKGLQDAVVQMEAKFKAFPSSPEFKAMSPQEQQEWTQAAPEGLKVMQDVAAQLVKMAQGFEQGAKQLTDFSKTADYVNPMKGVKSLPPQQATTKPAVTEDNQLLQPEDDIGHGNMYEIYRIKQLAGLKEADAPVAAPAPAPTTTAIVPAADVDPAETALKSAQVDPELMQQVEANTVRDAEGDVDLSATFQKIADQIPAEPQIRAEWAEAFKQFDEKFSHIEQDPEFMKMTPEEQVETKHDVQEVRALFQKFMEFAVQMSNTVKSGAQQVRTAMAAPGAQNTLKGVKTLTPPVQETADDQLLKQMLSIAGLR